MKKPCESFSLISGTLLVLCTCASSDAQNIFEFEDVVEGGSILSYLEPGYTVATQSFSGAMKSDANIIVSGSPWAEFVGVDDPISQVVGSGALTVEFRVAKKDPVRVNITALALEKIIPNDFGVCTQVWELGRAVDVDDLGIGSDGIHRCRVAGSWIKYTSGFCTQRRQCGVFSVEVDTDGNSSWALDQVFDDPSPGDDFGASIAIEGDVLLIGDPDGGGYSSGGRTYLHIKDEVDFILQQTLLPYDIKDLSLGDCAFDLEDHMLAYGRRDLFGASVDITENGVMCVIGAPGTIDYQTKTPSFVDGAGAIYIVHIENQITEQRIIFNPDSDTLSACGSEDSDCGSSGLYAQLDSFGTSVAIHFNTDSLVYRVAATAPGDFGKAIQELESGVFCLTDQGINQGPCHLETGSVVIYDLPKLRTWPDDTIEWSLKPLIHWKPGSSAIRDDDYNLAYARIGGFPTDDLGSSTVPRFTCGGSIDLLGDLVLIGGPDGRTAEKTNPIQDPACADWFGYGERLRGSALIMKVPFDGKREEVHFQELRADSSGPAPSWRYGEAVALINGRAAISLAWSESTQCSGNGVDCEMMGSIYHFTAHNVSSIPGDLNNDGLVSGSDIGIFLALFGQTGPKGDLNGDGFVNGIDLGILLANWSSSP